MKESIFISIVAHILNLYINYYIVKSIKDQKKYGIEVGDYLSKANRHGGNIRMRSQGTQPNI